VFAKHHLKQCTRNSETLSLPDEIVTSYLDASYVQSTQMPSGIQSFGSLRAKYFKNRDIIYLMTKYNAGTKLNKHNETV